MYNLRNEYEALLKRKESLEQELTHMAKGYISRKTINGGIYCYLQSKISGKLVSEYVKAEDVERIASELDLRRKHEEELSAIITRMEELERAAELIGNGMDRALMLYRLSSGMDELEKADRESCISFANAMNAIEGVPASQQTTEDLLQWQNGTKSYLAVFSAALKRYGFAVEV